MWGGNCPSWGPPRSCKHISSFSYPQLFALTTEFAFLFPAQTWIKSLEQIKWIVVEQIYPTRREPFYLMLRNLLTESESQHLRSKNCPSSRAMSKAGSSYYHHYPMNEFIWCYFPPLLSLRHSHTEQTFMPRPTQLCCWRRCSRKASRLRANRFLTNTYHFLSETDVM